MLKHVTKIICIFLGLLAASATYSSSTDTGLVLKCYARLGAGDSPTGMTLRYSVPEQKVVVNFVNQNNPGSLNHGQCTLGNQSLGGGAMGKFCHFNVNDIVYSKNLNSMNLTSDQAPYLIKIIKKGGGFSLNVHRENNLCSNGLVVDSVRAE
jgi:hypothetical protein